MDHATQTAKNVCIICGKPVTEADEAVSCSICGRYMHRSCADEEILTDANGNFLCPYDAALAALDWLDATLMSYSASLSGDERTDLVERLRRYIDILERIREE